MKDKTEIREIAAEIAERVYIDELEEEEIENLLVARLEEIFAEFKDSQQSEERLRRQWQQAAHSLEREIVGLNTKVKILSEANDKLKGSASSS